MERITPQVDLVFKKIFGVEENKDLLISLINGTVSLEDQVVDVRLLNPYNPQNFRSEQLSILDIKAVGQTGKRFNIEIQITDEADYDKRALYYWAKLYADQLQSSQDYATLHKAIGIHILNFISIPESNQYHNVFTIREQESGLPYFMDLELHTIELVKFSKDPNEDLEALLKKIKTSLDIWIAFLTRHDLLNKNNLPQPLATNTLKKALHLLGMMNFTDEERMAYEDHLQWLRIEINTLEKVRREGEQKGKIEGKIEGERDKAWSIAKAMLKKGFDKQTIMDITDVTLEEIDKLRPLQ